ncbi:hypothetical protein AAVH_21031 [Aphelenchoides avenae]|nr:hypothetical protein AAVH_21031 [Aphelenchus avenae]
MRGPKLASTQFDAINAILKAPKDASGNYNTFDCGNLPAAAKPIKFSFTPVPATTTTPAIAQEVSIDIQQLVFRTDDNVCTLRVQPQPAGDATKQNYWDFGLPLFRSVCSLVNVNGATKTIQFAPTKVAANYACTYNKPAVLQACNAPQTTSTAETTISPNATQAPSQTTTPKGASRGQVMSLLSVFTLFALSALF